MREQSKERAASLMEKQHYPLDYEDSGVIDEDASEDDEQPDLCKCGHLKEDHGEYSGGCEYCSCTTCFEEQEVE